MQTRITVTLLGHKTIARCCTEHTIEILATHCSKTETQLRQLCELAGFSGQWFHVVHSGEERYDEYNKQYRYRCVVTCDSGD